MFRMYYISFLFRIIYQCIFNLFSKHISSSGSTKTPQIAIVNGSAIMEIAFNKRRTHIQWTSSTEKQIFIPHMFTPLAKVTPLHNILPTLVFIPVVIAYKLMEKLKKLVYLSFKNIFLFCKGGSGYLAT